MKFTGIRPIRQAAATLTVALFACGVRPVIAQPPADSGVLPEIAPGQSVVVTRSSQGHTLKGRVMSFDASGLVLEIGDTSMLVSLPAIRRIERRGHGGVMGAVVGSLAAVGVACLQGCRSPEATDDPGLEELLALFSAGAGALVGAGAGVSLDHLRRDRRLLYEPTAGPRSTTQDGAAIGTLVGGLVGGLVAGRTHVFATLLTGGFGMAGGALAGALLGHASAPHSPAVSPTRRHPSLVVSPIVSTSRRGGVATIRW